MACTSNRRRIRRDDVTVFSGAPNILAHTIRAILVVYYGAE